MIRILLPWPPKDLSPNKRGVQAWTPEDDAFLKANHGKMQLHEIASRMGRSHSSLRARVTRLGLAKRVYWSAAEVAELTAAYERAGKYGVVRLNDLARRLGRDKTNVSRKARELGLSTNPNRRIVEHRRNRNKYANADEVSAAMSAAAKERIRKNGHPRGMLGKKHSQETRLKLSRASKAVALFTPEEVRAEWALKAIKARRANASSVSPKIARGSWKAGWREIGGKRNFYRSRWEANYARYLQWLKERGEIAEWEHEPETFWFEGIKRGVCSYLPDFRVTEKNGKTAIHEVKGWMDSRSRTTLKRMKKYYPNHPVTVIDGKVYRAIRAKVSRLIEGWEA